MQSLRRYKGDYVIRLQYDVRQRYEEPLSIAFLDKGKELLQIHGHLDTPFEVRGNTVYYGRYSRLSHGCTVVAQSIIDGSTQWSTFVDNALGKPMCFSIYSNAVLLRLDGDKLCVIGHEGIGDYTAQVDIKTGVLLEMRDVASGSTPKQNNPKESQEKLGQPGAWSEERACIGHSLQRYRGDNLIRMLYDSSRPDGNPLTITFLDGKQELLSIVGHVGTVFQVQGTTVYYVEYLTSTPDCTVVAQDIATHQVRWRTKVGRAKPSSLQGSYFSSVTLELLRDRLIVQGHETAGDYSATIDADTGRLVSKSETPATPEPGAGQPPAKK